MSVLRADPYLPPHTLFQQDGFVFRVRVACQREPQILREMRSPEGMISLRDTPASLRLERDTRHLPLLTSALHGYDHLSLWEARWCNGDMSYGVRQILERSPGRFTGYVLLGRTCFSSVKWEFYRTNLLALVRDT